MKSGITVTNNVKRLCVLKKNKQLYGQSKYVITATMQADNQFTNQQLLSKSGPK